MSNRTLFRVLVRLVGVYLLATSAPHIISAAAGLIFSAAILRDNALFVLVSNANTLAAIAIGVYLLRGPLWIVNLACRSHDPTCPRCDYVLKGLPRHGCCPECGCPYELPQDEAAESGTCEGASVD